MLSVELTDVVPSEGDEVVVDLSFFDGASVGGDYTDPLVLALSVMLVVVGGGYFGGSDGSASSRCLGIPRNDDVIIIGSPH